MWKSPLLKIMTSTNTTKQNLRPRTSGRDAGAVDGKPPMPFLEWGAIGDFLPTGFVMKSTHGVRL